MTFAGARLRPSCLIASNIVKRAAEVFASHAFFFSLLAGDRDDRCKYGIMVAARVRLSVAMRRARVRKRKCAKAEKKRQTRDAIKSAMTGQARFSDPAFRGAEALLFVAVEDQP